MSIAEPLLYPFSDIKRDLIQIEPSDKPARAVVFDLIRKLRDFAPDVILMTPWIKRGGSDLEVIHFAEALVALGVRCAVLTSTSEPSPWLNRLPESVMRYEFGHIAQKLSEQDKFSVLTHAILHSNTRAIHIMNCHYAWRMVAAHGCSLKQVGIQLFASLYCDDVEPDGRATGYATFPLPECCPWLDAITTDNKRFAHSVSYRTGYPMHKFFPLYYPSPAGRPPETWSETPVRNPNVLWASRITIQKTPHILAEIVRNTPDLTFHIYGEPDDRLPKEFFETLKSYSNCVLYGTYDDFSALCTSGDFGAFLYTSAWDGLPNVLLEALANGLPVVAPNIGGIAELIHEKTGWLVSDFSNVSEYKTQLLHAVNNVELSREKAKNAWDLLRTRHSKEALIKSIQKISNYPLSDQFGTG